MEVKCRKCNELIHPMRLEVLPDTKVCVKCSNVGKKAARIVSHGTGEEVSTDLEFLDQNTYRKVIAQEKGLSFKNISEIEIEEDKKENDYLRFTSSEEE